MSEHIREQSVQSVPGERIINVLDLINTDPHIEKVCLSMGGYRKQNVDGVITAIRKSKPKWSDDMIADVLELLNSAHSLHHTQTKMDKYEDIYPNLCNVLCSFNEQLYWGNGPDNYITEHMWHQIKDYANKNTLNTSVMSITSTFLLKFRNAHDQGNFITDANMLLAEAQAIIFPQWMRSEGGFTVEAMMKNYTNSTYTSQERRGFRLPGFRNRGDHNVS